MNTNLKNAKSIIKATIKEVDSLTVLYKKEHITDKELIKKLKLIQNYLINILFI